MVLYHVYHPFLVSFLIRWFLWLCVIYSIIYICVYFYSVFWFFLQLIIPAIDVTTWFVVLNVKNSWPIIGLEDGTILQVVWSEQLNDEQTCAFVCNYFWKKIRFRRYISKMLMRFPHIAISCTILYTPWLPKFTAFKFNR